MPKIVLQVGQCRDIALKTHAGTGFSWVLTALPEGLSLMDIATSSSAKVGVVGGPITETFTLFGLAKGSGQLTFALIRPLAPVEIADTRTYHVDIVEDAETAMANEAGQDNYLPMAIVACEGDDKDAVMLKSDANCVVKYGMIPPDKQCLLKYGFPVQPLYGVWPDGPVARYMVRPPIARYMAQPPKE